MLLIQRSWGELLAVPDLFVWILLLAFAAHRLGQPELTHTEAAYATLILIVDGISILFNLGDA